MSLTFEWDQIKARSNAAKHGVTFEEAVTAFSDITSLTIPDTTHSDLEDRFVLVGLSVKARHLVVVHTFRDDRVRVISARLANRREQEVWRHGKK